MGKVPDFLLDYLFAAKALVKARAVKPPVFSRGTYHVEVQEKGKKKAFSFLQMKENGEVSDCFCSCKESESGKGCIHLAASYLRIFNGYEEPLHVRFKKSFWNSLFQMESKRNGDTIDCLKKQSDGSYHCISHTKKLLFSIKPMTAGAIKQLHAIIDKRVEETEETSIKFSNLSAEEISQYRAGQASLLLRYELSFWADLAKWLMNLEGSLAVVFKGSPIPSEVELKAGDVEIWAYIAEVHWPELIPTLNTMHSNLQVIDAEWDMIQSVRYDEKAHSLQVVLKEGALEGGGALEGPIIADWRYVAGKGFYRLETSPLLKNGEIHADKIAEVLTQSRRELQSFLPIHPEAKKAQYFLSFDQASNLHIQMYVLERGDVQREGAACFSPWFYIPSLGFYLLENLLFEGTEKVVLKQDVAEFINRHRLWLHQFPGFQTHLGSLESNLTYGLNREDELFFDVELNLPEEDMVNFEEWIYVRGQGFYMKKESRGRLPLHPGLRVPKEQISSFIQGHFEELEQVHGFFSTQAPIQQMGLSISLNEEGLIVVTPKMQYAVGVDPEKVKSFGDFFYVEGRGFSSIPLSASVPERYRSPQVIPILQESSFFSYELEPLKPYILDIDSRLKKPTHLKLKIQKIARNARTRSEEWLVDLVYESEFGSASIFPLWDAVQEKRRHLFSDAGMLFLKDPRFNWLRQLHKKRLDRRRGVIRLNTLEWMRLCAFEEIDAPKGGDPSSTETRLLLEELSRFETNRMLDISGLQSTLRPYQEAGVHWLWFLYCHGLSGLLCDDMGLGKTHQAMALLAAVINADTDKRNKYLVVCPTSVIYHWQELLKRFLPNIRVSTYYGLTRSLDNFDADYDLLLTSYGILRSAREELRGISFELAIFDEIQVAKNEASQTHQALRCMNVKMRLGLTGTPIENRLREIKSLFDVVLPSYMPSDANFRDLFVIPIEKNNDAEKKALLTKLIKPFILRRKKSEVLRDLPEKIEEISYCDLSLEQKQLYIQVAEQMRETVYQELKDESKPVPYLHVFAALSKMKQICNHPALSLGDAKQYEKHASGKWDLFVELLYEARESGQKVVVFSQYLEMLAIIESYLKKKGIGYASIKGSTRDRSEQLRKFREDPACEVFVASLLAAGVGIDLTVASIVIHYDRWWNPAKENQATDRVHRIGQSRGVQVFKLVTKGTIEEHIHEIIEKKKGLLEQIVGTDDQINYLNREELLQVFKHMFET